MKRILAVLMVVILAFLLCSCGIMSGDATNLMKPPKPAGNKYDIQEALERDATDITMKYPSSGEHRSAFVMKDLNGDGQDEVLAFYSTKGDSAGSGVLYVGLLADIEGEWTLVDKKKIDDAANVESVAFVDFDNNTHPEIVVGFSLLSGLEKLLKVYSFTGSLYEIFSQNYSEYTTAALTGDVYPGTQTPVINLFLTKLSATDPPVASARLFSLNKNAFTENGTAAIDGYVSEYGELHVTTSNNVPCVLIDAYKGTEAMITDVVYYDTALTRLRAPTFNSKTQQSDQTLRPTITLCRDIDNDGVIEIPYVSPLPSLRPSTGKVNENAQEKNTLYLTRWSAYDIAHPLQPHPVLTAVMVYSDQYYFKMPEKWLFSEQESEALGAEAKVTVLRDTAARECAFYVYDHAAGKTGAHLFSIKVFGQSTWAAGAEKGYVLLKKTGDLIYGLKMTGSTSPLSLSEQEIRDEGFSLIS